MPMDRRDRSVSTDSCKAYPFPCSSSRIGRPSTNLIESENKKNKKEWEEVRCPVCMEHPHNAVLLICSSHGNGCRPYMCDTSYRHSNCLDQFRKSSPCTPPASVSQEEEMSHLAVGSPHITELQQESSEEGSFPLHTVSVESPTKPKLLCPLCRGKISGWIVEEPARIFMNTKLRSCSCETCDFSGTYSDLRKHARVDHPTLRPCETDPERERRWRRLERQRDIGDLLSSLQSSFGEERGERSLLPMDDGGWLTVILLIQVLRPGSRSRSSSWSGTSRARAQLRVRRRPTRLWGESYDINTESSPRDDDTEVSDGGSRLFQRRTRRRTTPENQE